MLKQGHFGDHKQISKDLFELRFFFGPGYRIYYTIRDDTIIFLLAGGDKSIQELDIKRAKEFLAVLEGWHMGKDREKRLKELGLTEEDFETSPWDVTKYLKTDDDIRGFLAETLAIGDESDFIHALGAVARAKGMSKIASEIGVTRNSLYKSLSRNGNPRFETISKVTKALGLRMMFV